jgi:uncharacterized protein YkwD
MKKIILFIFSISLTLSAFSQSYLDYLLFEKCNQYRSQNGLREWEWSDRAFKPAEHHSDYQVKTGIMGHKENTITPWAVDRLKYYGIDWEYSGENCAVVMASGSTYEQIANLILKLWKESPSHNRLLLNPEDGEFAAISCKIGRNYKWSKDEYNWMFCTLTVFTEH